MTPNLTVQEALLVKKPQLASKLRITFSVSKSPEISFLLLGNPRLQYSSSCCYLGASYRGLGFLTVTQHHRLSTLPDLHSEPLSIPSTHSILIPSHSTTEKSFVPKRGMHRVSP